MLTRVTVECGRNEPSSELALILSINILITDSGYILYTYRKRCKHPHLKGNIR